MKYSEAKQGRTFVIRLEDGDIVHHEIEKFAREKKIQAATMIILGGADAGSVFITGPEEDRSEKVVIMEHVLDHVHEISGTGTLFPDEDGNPTLHMHMAAGRKDKTITGCVRNGVKVWHIMEIVLFELVETSASRILDPALEFKLLSP